MAGRVTMASAPGGPSTVIRTPTLGGHSPAAPAVPRDTEPAGSIGTHP